MKTILGLIALLILVAECAVAADRPNVLLIAVDDALGTGAEQGLLQQPDALAEFLDLGRLLGKKLCLLSRQPVPLGQLFGQCLRCSVCHCDHGR